MEEICFVCNAQTEFYQRNLMEIRSKHSGKQISYFIEKCLDGHSLNRNIDDESNCICINCLDEIYSYDRMCAQVAEQEKKLRDLLLSTGYVQAIDEIEVKIEPPTEIYHNETIFVKEVNEFCEEDCIEMKEEPELENDVLLSVDGTMPIGETVPSASFATDNQILFENHENGEYPALNSKTVPAPIPKNVRIKKSGKIMRRKLMKCNVQGNNGKQLLSKVKTLPVDNIPQELKTNTVSMNEKKAPWRFEEGFEAVKHVPLEQIAANSTNLIQPLEISSLASTSVSSTSLSTLQEIPPSNKNRLSTPELKRIVLRSTTQTKPLEIPSKAPQIESSTPISTKSENNNQLQRKLYYHECTVCNDGVTYNKKSYEVHIRTHKKECSKCDVNLTNKSIKRVRVHMKWHEKNPGFVCRQCCWTLEDKESYLAHMDVHKDKAPHTCVLCDKVLHTKCSLRKHVQVVHRKMQQHLCDLCGKVSTSMTTLKTHLESHSTKEKTIKCPKCPKLLKSNYYLSQHMRCHKTDRPFSCSVCGMKFKRREHCQTHEKRHTEDTKTRKCVLCPAAYEFKCHLKEHIKRKHKAEMPTGTLETNESNVDKDI